MTIDKKVINYYYSFYEVSKELDQAQFYAFNMAICQVMFFEKHINEIEFTDALLSILWKSIKHSIQSSIEGYCNKKNIPYEDIFTPLANPLANPLDNKEKEKEKEKEKVERKFKKPTIKEVDLYISNNNYSINAVNFYDYYESNGWKVGKNSMKDWKATVRQWNSRNNKDQSNERFFV